MMNKTEFFTTIMGSLLGVVVLVGVAMASHTPDLNGDGKVDAADLTILKSQWGATGTADLNHDGIVNTRDAGILFSSWGTVPAPTCNTSTVGTNQLVGCLWEGTNFTTADGSAQSGPTLSAPTPTSATALDINWGASGPNTTVGSDTFSARWKGSFTFPAGTYTFTGGSDDGMRVRLNGTTKIDQWVDRSYTENSFSQTFSAQTTVILEIDYYENTGSARVNFRWAASTPPSSMGPLKVSTTNPRYFADPSGKIVYLAGSHQWHTLIDHGTTDPPPATNYTGYLDLLTKHKHNYIRMWAFDLTRYNCNSGIRYAAPSPWSRPGPGTAMDGKSKFDLTKFNQAYFDRLRSRVIAARDRGIYVGINLHEGLIPSKCDTAGGNPFRLENNINGINGDSNGDGKAIEVYTLQNSAITRLQEGYIRKLIDTVNDLDNVLFEISNENHSGSVDWQNHVTNYIKTYEASKPSQHPVGISAILNVANSVLFASAADWIAPSSEPSGSGDLYSTNPPIATGKKVVFPDTDHLYNNAEGSWGTPESRADKIWVWKSFTRGYNPVYIDPYDLSQPDQVSPSAPNRQAVVSARAAMGQTITYSRKINLATMLPSTALCSTTYCLANPGSEYLVYAPSGGSFTVNLVGATYTYEWFNPSTGAVTGSGTFTAGSGNRSFTTPFSGDGVIYLKKQ